VSIQKPRPLEAGDLPLADSFDCGESALNEWLQKYAWQNHTSGAARIYVAIDAEPRRIAGYFCLSAASAEYAGAPTRVGKGLARHPIPVVLIGRLGVDQRYQGQGLARFLVREAFQRTINIADTIGVRAVMVRAKDDSLSAFYEKLGFESSVTESRLMFMTIKDVKKSLAVAARSPRS
jgi:GNAT superfamily N-acetyltransferase